MPIPVGYRPMPQGGTIDLAGASVRQQQLQMQKREQQRKQWQEAIDAISEAYKTKQKEKKFKEQMSEMRAAGYEPKMSMSSEGKMSATFEKKSYADVAKEAKAVSDIAGYQQEEQFQQTAGRLMEAPSPMGMQRGPRNPMEQMRTQLGTTGQALVPGAKGWEPKGIKKPEGYAQSLSNAIKAINEGNDPWKVYQKTAQMFPKQSAELKRILIPSAKLGELDISDALWGD